MRNALVSLCASFGGVATEELLLASSGSNGEKDRSALRFLFSSFPEFSEARETQRTKAHWTTTAPIAPGNESAGTDAKRPAPAGPSLETVLEAGERILEGKGALVPEAAYFEEIQRVLGVPVTDAVLCAYLSVSKRIVRNLFGNFGLRTSREAVPRSVGDKAYLVLKAHGQPLHFRAVVDEINRAGFDQKRALAETVHNDLIRDSRFVLVGRGMYALREWGFSPGRVSEVIVRLLRQAGRPLQKSEIVAEVLKQRFVKRNTVLLCLLDRSLFTAGPDGVYALVERDGSSPPPPPPAP
ncbi:MAG: winged helix-turn-helix domain-containing protein [bacterium]|nr:winged helix-turn-helix domain-containing protein [bacterium]